MTSREALAPHRVQLSRKKGWRMPPNTIKVARPCIDGNPYIVGYHGTAEECVAQHRAWLERAKKNDPQSVELMAKRLRGKNLACWCALDKPCHADVLLELANK